MKFSAVSVPEPSCGSGGRSVLRRLCCGGRAVRMLLGFVLVLFGASLSCPAKAVRVMWAGNPETDIAGYEIRYGTRSGTYPNVVRVGSKSRSTVVGGLAAGTRYYFTLVAFNTSGMRGAPSREAVYETPGAANQPPDGWIINPATGGTVLAGDPVRFSAGANDPDAKDSVSVRWSFGASSGIPDATGLNPGTVRFSRPGTHEVVLRVTDSRGLSDPTPARRLIHVLPAGYSPIPRDGWVVRHVDSEEDGFAATRSFDGDPSTFWHTAFRTNIYKKPPHELQIKLARTENIGGFRYLPRQDNFNIGNIVTYRFYVSGDGTNWGPPVASGRFDDSKGEKEIRFRPKRGAYIRLVAVDDAGGSVHSNVAELNLLSAPPANREPSAKRRKLATRQNKPLRVVLSGSDPDGNPLSFRIVGKPKHGQLRGIAPRLVYRPKRGFKGIDRIRYLVSDGKASSKVVTIRIRVGGKAKKQKKSAQVRAVAEAARRKNPGRVSTEVIAGRKYKVLTVRKDKLAPGRRPLVEVSPDRLDWSSGGRHTTVLRNDRKVLRVRDNTPVAPGRKRHIRLRQVSR